MKDATSKTTKTTNGHGEIYGMEDRQSTCEEKEKKEKKQEKVRRYED